MAISLAGLKRQLQPTQNASWHRDGCPRKQAREVQHVDTISDVRKLDLRRHASEFFAVKLCASGKIKRESRTGSFAVKIDAIKNCGAVLGQQKGLVLSRIGGKAA